VALAQDEGRGRQGRAWQAPGGNFSGSTLVQLRAGDPAAPTLSLVCGLALIEALDTVVAGAALQLKWPNDLMLGGAKLAGILLERSGDRIVAGFGVNLAAAPEIEGRPTAALPSSAPILPQAFAPLLALWRGATPDAFAQAWLARAHPLGTVLTVHDRPGHQVAGTFAGIDPDGALLLNCAGRVEVVRAGDVSL